MPERFTEIQPKIAYNIPFEWGQLFVSEQAHDAYGLVPFTMTDEGASTHIELLPQDGPTTFLTLVGPHEYGCDAVLPDIPEAPDIVIRGKLRFPFGREELTVHTREALPIFLDEALLGEPNQELIRTALDIGLSQTYDESGYCDATQVIAHSIARLAERSTAQTYIRTRIEALRETSKLQRKRDALLAWGLGGTMLAGMSMFEGGITPSSVSFAALAALAVSTRSFNRSLEEVADSYITRDELAHEAAVQASQVYIDVHKTFCRQNVNEHLSATVY